MSIHILDENISIVKQWKRSAVKPEQVSIAISRGNKKYHDSDDTAFLIWSITEGITCPFATKMCAISCYAKKASTQYKNVRIARQENLRAVYNPLFVEKMAELILSKARRGNLKNKKRIIVRVHEAGDYFADWYVDKWIEIARIVSEADSRIEFWSYTKSFVYFIGKKWPESFRIRGSVWADTDPEQLKLIESLNLPIYTAVEKFAENDGYAHCRCEDCATCETPCGDMSIRKTACEIH